MSFRTTIDNWNRGKRKVYVDASITAALRGEPSKNDLREMLAEAARNTSKLQAPTDGDHHASDH